MDLTDRVYEPLAETAPLARAMAARSCAEDHGCRNYHGVWQYLRLLGLNTTLRADRMLFVDAFRDAARSGLRRVLISAAADYGMLAQLLHAYRAEGVEPTCVLVDRCATPLQVNADYARRVGARLETVQGDIMGLDLSPVDLICTHSFLSFIVPEERPALCRLWYAMLRPCGRLVTSNPVYLSHAPDAGRGSAVLECYHAEVLAAARAMPSLDMAPEELADAAVALRTGMSTWMMHDAEEVSAPLRAAGFRLDRMDMLMPDAREQGPFSRGREGKRRVFVVATRPV